MNNELFYEVVFNPIEWTRCFCVSDVYIVQLLKKEFPYFCFEESDASGKTICAKITADVEGYTFQDYESNAKFEKITGEELLAIFGTVIFDLKNFNNDKFWFLHAGACVSDNNKLIVVVGPTHAGKSTLISQLIADNRFTYLTDDSLAYDKKKGKFIGFPRPISLRTTQFIENKLQYSQFEQNGVKFWNLKNDYMSSGVKEYDEIIVFSICREKNGTMDGPRVQKITPFGVMMLFIMNSLKGRQISENHMMARQLCNDDSISAFSVVGYEGDEAYEIICRKVFD